MSADPTTKMPSTIMVDEHDGGSTASKTPNTVDGMFHDKSQKKTEADATKSQLKVEPPSKRAQVQKRNPTKTTKHNMLQASS